MEGWLVGLVGWELEVGSWRPDVGGPKADWQAGRWVGWLQNGSWRLDQLISWQVDHLAIGLGVGRLAGWKLEAGANPLMNWQSSQRARVGGWVASLSLIDRWLGMGDW